MVKRRTVTKRKGSARSQTPLRYGPDNGPLTSAQKRVIHKLQPPGRLKVKEQLF